MRLFSYSCFVLLYSFFISLPVYAQLGHVQVMDSLVRTIQMNIDGNSNVLPVICKDQAQTLNLSFDYMSHEYQRFTYHIEHCDFQGKLTEDLFPSDYMYSISEENCIDDYEYSTNTTVHYTHYSLQIPNQGLRPLASGNYLLTVEIENGVDEPQPVFRTYFAVLDPRTSIRPTMTTNTDLDWNQGNQQMSLEVNCNDLLIRDAAEEIQLVVMQNQRIDQSVYVTEPTSQNGNKLIWSHCKDLIFPAGNEYRKIEMLTTRYPGLHCDYIRWIEPYYRIILFNDEPRRNYLFDKDNNGFSVVRCEDSSTPEIEADYALTHFTLMMPQNPMKDVYVFGGWTMFGDYANYVKMNYNKEKQAYEADLLLKLGYYNYQYVFVDFGASPFRGNLESTEGNFYQTENKYDVLVYYKPLGGRYQQLVGFISFIYKP